jgi:hypothetical protein
VAEEVPPEERMAEQVLLQLREITITVTRDRVIISIRGASGDLSHKEWRVVKTFIDAIIAEMRARPAR